MASPAQITANRLNAAKSTGPRSVEGKAASSRNALKHGIDAHASVLPGEDPDAYEALAAEYRERFQPANAEQSFLVETLIQSDWNRRRYMRIQAELTARLLDDMDPEDRSLAALFMPGNAGGRALNRVLRQYQAAQNAWFRAFKDLERLQKLAAEAAIRMAMFAASENWVRSEDLPPTPDPLPELPATPGNWVAFADTGHDPNLALRL